MLAVFTRCSVTTTSTVAFAKEMPTRTRSTRTSKHSVGSVKKEKKLFVASDYLATEKGLLTVFEGDSVTVILESQGSPFLFVRDKHGAEGYVPACILSESVEVSIAKTGAALGKFNFLGSPSLEISPVEAKQRTIEAAISGLVQAPLEERELPWRKSGFFRAPASSSELLSLPSPVRAAETLECPSPVRSTTPSVIDDLERISQEASPKVVSPPAESCIEDIQPPVKSSTKKSEKTTARATTPSKLKDLTSNLDIVSLPVKSMGIGIRDSVKLIAEKLTSTPTTSTIDSNSSLRSEPIKIKGSPKMLNISKKPEKRVQSREQMLRVYLGEAFIRDHFPSFVSVTVDELDTLDDIERISKEKMQYSGWVNTGPVELGVIHYSKATPLDEVDGETPLWKVMELAKLTTLDEKGYSLVTEKTLESLSNKTRKELNKRLLKNSKYGRVSINRIVDRHPESDFVTNYKFILNPK